MRELRTYRLSPMSPREMAARIVGGFFLGFVLLGLLYLEIALCVHQAANGSVPQ